MLKLDPSHAGCALLATTFVLIIFIVVTVFFILPRSLSWPVALGTMAFISLLSRVFK